MDGNGFSTQQDDRATAKDACQPASNATGLQDAKAEQWTQQDDADTNSDITQDDATPSTQPGDIEADDDADMTQLSEAQQVPTWILAPTTPAWLSVDYFTTS